jgi:hypothetical protein
VNWLAQLQTVAALSPSPESLVLDSWAGSLAFSGVRFDHKQTTWSTVGETNIVVEGEAATRDIADALRAALIDTDGMRTTTTGADAAGGKRLPAGFTYRLQGLTKAAAPSAQPSAGKAQEAGS